VSVTALHRSELPGSDAIEAYMRAYGAGPLEHEDGSSLCFRSDGLELGTERL